MLIATTNDIPGMRVVKTLGTAQGSAVRVRHIGSDIVGAPKGLVGGEVKGYSRLMEGARTEAIQRMKTEAAEMGANALTGVRFTTSMIVSCAAEILAYGTAVVIEE